MSRPYSLRAQSEDLLLSLRIGYRSWLVTYTLILVKPGGSRSTRCSRCSIDMDVPPWVHSGRFLVRRLGSGLTIGCLDIRLFSNKIHRVKASLNNVCYFFTISLLPSMLSYPNLRCYFLLLFQQRTVKGSGRVN